MATAAQWQFEKEEMMTDFAKLQEFDFVVVVDKSGSMSKEDCANGQSRWKYMQETAGAFCRSLGKLDGDGLNFVLFSGNSIEKFEGVTAATVDNIFATCEPGGSTPLDSALSCALELAGKSDKKDFILCFTDGEPDNKEAVATVIRNAAERQATDDALTILFVQVGADAGATAYLQELDTLTGCKFDIVDAKTITEAEKFASIGELILAAIEG